jgi:hypothetical protein
MQKLVFPLSGMKQDPVFHDIHRLNIELDLQSLFGLHVHSCTHWLKHRNLPPPPFVLIRGRFWSAKIDDISLCTKSD